MSEYQYYEFLAVDRPLTSEEMAGLRRISTRADIDRFVVPLLESPKQTAIGDLLRHSLQKHQESKRLLDQAKNPGRTTH
ncbi:MAG: hypothetical protein KKB20_04365 [Proteobacteria bacterium]|nr:hypothetical protein [Pseudomonadota bacterium]